MFDSSALKMTLTFIAILSASLGQLSVSWGQAGDSPDQVDDLGSTPKTALRGVALVIGQSKYKHLAALPNPVRDADRLEELLTELGFETNTVTNRKSKRLRRDIAYLIEDAEEADVALLYYSGHGVEVDGVNYLVPIDVKVSETLIDSGSMINLNETLDRLSRRAEVVIILLDACRDNPFPDGARIKLAQPKATSSGTSSGSERSALLPRQSGLGVMRGARRSDLPSHATRGQSDASNHNTLGEVISYAAAPGRVALDGDQGGVSPYANALLKHLSAPGLEFGQVMTLVAEEVYLATRGAQRPWVNASLRRLLYFGGSVEPPPNDEALIEGERRRLLLTISTVPPVMKRTVEGVASVNDLPLDALFAMLRQLDIDPEGDSGALTKQLRRGAERLKRIMIERDAIRVENPEMRRLLKLADRALNSGALDSAQAFYRRAKAQVKRLESHIQDVEGQARQRRIEFASVFTKSAHANELTYDWRSAAEDWARAAEQLKLWAPERSLDYRAAEVSALSAAGEHDLDIEALEQAHTRLETLAREVIREQDPARWRIHQGLSADLLLIQGEIEGSPALLKRAVKLLRAVEESLESESERLNLQVRLSCLLFKLSELQESSTPLHEAIAILRDALTRVDPSDEALMWAMIQNTLGLSLLRLGERVSQPDLLRRSVEAFRAALTVYTQDIHPLDWSVAQNNLGLAFLRLGERNIDRDTLHLSIKAFTRALTARARSQLPMEWAMTQSNLCLAQYTLGEREAGTEVLKSAMRSCRAALEEYTEDRAPLFWATTQHNLALILHILGTRERGIERLQRSLRVSQSISRVYTRDELPIKWAIIQNTIGNILMSLGERSSGLGMLKRSVKAFDGALQVFTRERAPVPWASLQNNRALPLKELGRRASDLEALRNAQRSLEAALTVRSRERLPLEWAMSHTNRAEVLRFIATLTGDVTLLDEALKRLDDALTARTRNAVPLDWAMTTTQLSLTLTARARAGQARRGDLERAETLARAALKENIAARAPLQRALSLTALGLAQREREDLEAAWESLTSALELLAPDQSRSQWLDTNLTLVEVELALAASSFDHALKTDRDADPKTEIKSELQIGLQATIERAHSIRERLNRTTELVESTRADLTLVRALLFASEVGSLASRIPQLNEVRALLSNISITRGPIGFGSELSRCRLGLIEYAFATRPQDTLNSIRERCLNALNHPSSKADQRLRSEVTELLQRVQVLLNTP